MSNAVEPTAPEGNSEGASPQGEELQREDLSEQPRKRLVELLTGLGLAATTAGLLTDYSLSDVAAAITGGLVTVGVISAGAAALNELRRRWRSTGKVEALEELRQEINEQKDAGINSEALGPVLDRIDALIGQLERSSARMGWRQGAVYAIFTTAVAILLVVFSHWIPVVK